MGRLKFIKCVGVLIGTLTSGSLAMAQSPERSMVEKGYVGMETFYYPRDDASGRGHGSTALMAQVEVNAVLGDGWNAKFTPFIRFDFQDETRRTADAREAEVDYTGGPWVFAAGMRQVSWSVAESVNVVPHQVVDIINQRDLAADPAGQEKLGAAMAMVSYQEGRDLVQGFILPRFRERRFPDTEAREHPFRGAVDLNNGTVEYVSDEGAYRLGGALRWEHSFDSANTALIGYQGYAPQPLFTPDAGTNNVTALYYLVNMFGMTLQATAGEWTVKSETAYFGTRLNPDRYLLKIPDNYYATVTGIERTLVRFVGQSDLNMFLEWMYDSRGLVSGGSTFQNDIFLGLRWVANDASDTQILGGTVQDLGARASIFHAQFQRRLGSHFQLQSVLRYYRAEEQDPLYAFTDDTLIYLKLRYFF